MCESAGGKKKSGKSRLWFRAYAKSENRDTTFDPLLTAWGIPIVPPPRITPQISGSDAGRQLQRSVVNSSGYEEPDGAGPHILWHKVRKERPDD